MEITILDYLVFFIFVGGVALFGCSFYFRSRKGAAAFTAAEGSLPTWVVGMSIFATFVSSISFLGLPGDAYKGNWNPFVFSLSIPSPRGSRPRSSSRSTAESTASRPTTTSKCASATGPAVTWRSATC